ncbi:hypothetical protein LJB42_000477 [Komagataella kurtzmanii]|nr:hypothetical protein LJB42_000477 [Komagataella kurtzmanii]
MDKSKIRYKRSRSARACEVCHARKVRCDAVDIFPCTNCKTFGNECVIPEVRKRRARKIDEEKNGDLSLNSSPPASSSSTTKIKPELPRKGRINLAVSATETIAATVTPGTSADKSVGSSYKNQTWDFSGNTSCLNQVMATVSTKELSGSEYYRSPEVKAFHEMEMEALKIKGAFLIPTEELCKILISCYFQHVHPWSPIINRTHFEKHYLPNLRNPPSILLLQCVLLAGSRVCKHPQLMDPETGSVDTCSFIFYYRAKAIYDSNLETDPISLVQSISLLGHFWESAESVVKNIFYWSRLAITLAQSYGFHRCLQPSSKTSAEDLKLIRRIFWCLFIRDRGISVAFGRPLTIDLDDCDVPLLSTRDFIEIDEDNKAISPLTLAAEHVDFVMHSLKLAEIMGIVLKQQYTVKAENLESVYHINIVKHCDMIMGNWLHNLPSTLCYHASDPAQQSLPRAIINCNYYAVLCLIHRRNILKRVKHPLPNKDDYYPSWGVTFQAAHMISQIGKYLQTSGQLQYVSNSLVFSFYIATVMMIYHLYNKNRKAAAIAKQSIDTLCSCLNELSKVWKIALLCSKILDILLKDEAKRLDFVQNVICVSVDVGKKNKVHIKGQNVQTAENGDAFLSEDPKPKENSGNDLSIPLNEKRPPAAIFNNGLSQNPNLINIMTQSLPGFTNEENLLPMDGNTNPDSFPAQTSQDFNSLQHNLDLFKPNKLFPSYDNGDSHPPLDRENLNRLNKTKNNHKFQIPKSHNNESPKTEDSVSSGNEFVIEKIINDNWMPMFDVPANAETPGNDPQHVSSATNTGTGSSVEDAHPSEPLSATLLDPSVFNLANGNILNPETVYGPNMEGFDFQSGNFARSDWFNFFQ